MLIQSIMGTHFTYMFYLSHSDKEVPHTSESPCPPPRTQLLHVEGEESRSSWLWTEIHCCHRLHHRHSRPPTGPTVRPQDSSLLKGNNFLPQNLKLVFQKDGWEHVNWNQLTKSINIYISSSSDKSEGKIGCTFLKEMIANIVTNREKWFFQIEKKML